MNPICIYSVDTGKVRELILEKNYAYPRWAPDGRHLYVQAPVSEGQGIYRIELQSGAATEVLKSRDAEYFNVVQVSSDQKWMVYGHDVDRDKVCQIILRDLTTGNEKEIGRTSLDINTYELSPDGKQVAVMLRVEDNLRVMKVMAIPDGALQEIYRFKQSGRYSVDMAWSPDGRFIYFSSDPESNLKWHLQRIRAAGGAAEDLGVVMRRFESISIHPDGKRLTFTSMAPTAELYPDVWVLENFLPQTVR